MNAFTLIVLGAAVFTLLGCVAAALLWLKNADLADQVDDYIDRLREALLDNARLRLSIARERIESQVATAPKVVPIRAHKGHVA